MAYNDPYTYFNVMLHYSQVDILFPWCFILSVALFIITDTLCFGKLQSRKSRSILFKILFYSEHCSRIISLVWLWIESVLQVCQALLLSLSAVSLSLVCEEDGTEVESDEFLMTLPDNTALMVLEPGQTWRARPVRLTKEVFDYIGVGSFQTDLGLLWGQGMNLVLYDMS